MGFRISANQIAGFCDIKNRPEVVLAFYYWLKLLVSQLLQSLNSFHLKNSGLLYQNQGHLIIEGQQDYNRFKYDR